VGKKPMCATVCPSGALFFGERTEIERARPRSRPLNEFVFGAQTIHTKVNMMVPRDAAVEHVDVTASMHDAALPRLMASVSMDAALFDTPAS